jgi:putative oxidoreductase
MPAQANIPQPSILPFVGRLLIAAIFLLSGFGKVMAPTGTIGYITSAGLPFPTLAYLISTVIEVAGGLALVLGYQTRAVSLVIALYVLATALFFHTAFGDQNQMIHFMKNLAMTGGLLQITAFGAGAFSLDNRRAARTT